MILQALHALYERKQDELPPEGFEQKEIPFLLVLNKDGSLIDLQDTRHKSGKKVDCAAIQGSQGQWTIGQECLADCQPALGSLRLCARLAEV